MRSHLTQRAQRLIDEFEEGANMNPGAIDAGQSIRHGIAAVLRHLAATESDEESWYAVPASRLDQLAENLIAPTLIERALAGDKAAARQFLHEAGFTDADGRLLPHLRTPEP
jgi:hypothetical protein